MFGMWEHCVPRKVLAPVLLLILAVGSGSSLDETAFVQNSPHFLQTKTSG
eukprot:CAMPEP_0202842362 /NCGR_PEP_ID=MMETSP1389-20130828/61255_1 /ASSEMBLY_ACC=CAM_ASM_000865 /TAXON_ID=302021 /ORGANISM="Rhodomonas sp., Strain CCMP768" /LENGTH=49 /DNA_ID= /DNA_START= /DNA_END= /DNA_ORIENTATION=